MAMYFWETEISSSMLNGLMDADSATLEVTLDGNTYSMELDPSRFEETQGVIHLVETDGNELGDEFTIGTVGDTPTFVIQRPDNAGSFPTHCKLTYSNKAKLPESLDVVTNDSLMDTLFGLFEVHETSISTGGTPEPIPCGVKVDDNGEMTGEDYGLTLLDIGNLYGDLGGGDLSFDIHSYEDGDTYNYSIHLSETYPYVKIIASGGHAYVLVYEAGDYSGVFEDIDQYIAAYQITDWKKGLFLASHNSSAYYISSLAMAAADSVSAATKTPFLGFGAENSNVTAGAIAGLSVSAQ